MKAQQKRFDRWRQEYNHDRPHEALDMLRPGEVYRASAKRLGEKDQIRYPSGYEVKRVSGSGRSVLLWFELLHERNPCRLPRRSV